MEQKNNQTGGGGATDTGVRPAPDGFDLQGTTGLAGSLDAVALADSPTGTGFEGAAGAPRSQWKRLLLRRDVITVASVLVIAVAAVVLVVAQQESRNSKKVANGVPIVAKYDTQQVPLTGISVTPQGASLVASNIVVNGSLKLNDGLIIVPSVQPNAPTAGEMYFDRNTNQLAYYNGTAFVPLGASESVVQSIGGIAGQVTLGGGLSVLGNQLNVNFPAAPAAVSSFGGQTGQIGLGGGLRMAGNALQNDGVLNIVAGANIAVTNDGSGTYTISNIGAGTGTVTGGGGTAGTFPVFTGAQNIENSILSQSGGTVTLAGSLSVITGGLSLANALTVGNGGTGATSLAANGVVVSSGTAPFTAITAGAAGLCFMSTAGAPGFSACPSGGGGGVTSLNGLVGALSIANATAAAGTVTLDDATTSAKGIASFNSANFSVTGGAVNTIQNIAATASPTFNGVTANSFTSTGSLTVGSSAQPLTLLGNGSSTFGVTGSGQTTTIGFNGSPSGAVNYNFDRSAAAGTYTICTTAANCAGAGGGVTTSGGTANRLLRFSGSQTAGDSSVSDNGSLVTVLGTANLLVQGGTGTFGTLTQAGSVAISDGSNNTATIVISGHSADRTYTIPDAGANATFCLSTGNCVGGTGGAPNNAEYLVATLNGTLTNERALASGNNVTVTDGGANGNMTVATVNNPSFTTSVTTPALQSSGALTISSAAGTTVALDAGTTIELQDSTNVTGSLDVSGGLNAGSSNAFVISSSGAITAAAGITSSGTVTFSGLNCTANANGGALTANAFGVISCSDDDGGAASAITGSGNNGTITMFTGAQTIANSIISQSGTTITIAGDLALSTNLSVANGGTGVSSFTANGVVYGNGTGALQVTGAGTSGQVLLANGSGVPGFVSIGGDVTVSSAGVAAIQANSVALGTDTTGNYIANIGTLTGLTAGANSGEGSMPSLSVNYGSSANTAVQGNTSLTCASGTGNLTGGGTSITLGTGGSCGAISTVNNPSFTTSVTTPSLIITGAGSNGTLQVANLGQATTYTLPDPGAGAATICLSTGNCAGSGSGVTTAGGTTNRLSKFTGAQALGDSTLSDNGSVVTVNGTANLVVQGGTGTFGTLTQAGTLAISDGSNNTVSIVAAGLAADRTYTLPDAGGAASFCLSTGNCVGGGSGGAPNSAAYLVASLDGTLTNERALSQGSNVTVTDGGANGNMTVATVMNPSFTTSVTTPTLQSSGALTITSAAGTVVAIDAGTTIELQDSTNVTGSLDVSASFNAGTSNAFAVNSSGIITAAAGITSSGTITFSGLNCTANANGGALTANALGVISCSDDDGGAAGTVTGSGSNGTVALFNSTNTLTNSIITQSGTTITIAGDLNLSTDLSVANGGTGASTFTTRGLLYGNGTGAVQVTAAGTSGQVLVADASGVPTFVGFSGDVAVSNTGATTIQANSVALGTDTTGNYVGTLGVATGLTVGSNTGEGSTPTLSVDYGSSANTAVQGNVTLACPSGSGNLTGGGTSITLGTGGTCGALSTVNNPSFTTSVTTPLLQSTGTMTLTPGGALTIGATGQSFTMQGNGSSVIAATNSGFVTTVGFTGTATGAVRYNLDQAATPGTYNICTSAGNCPSGGNVSTAGGTTNRLAKFTSGTAIGDSIITDNGTTVSVAGNLSATALVSATLDTGTAVALNIGAASPTTTAINLNQSTVLAAGKSLAITGGNTASRPASPTEGMVYFDTTTKALLVYANGKWQADRTIASKIVAMGSPAGCTGSVPSASANTDGADYIVNSCTSAQTIINTAISALPAAGGTLYLMDGTYIIDGSISLSNNVIFAGTGTATIIKFKNSINASINGITNSNTSTGNTNIVLRDFRFDGNSSNQTAGNQYAIQFTKLGISVSTRGGEISGVYVENARSNGIDLLASYNVAINKVAAISNGGYGVSVGTTSTQVSVSDSRIEGNGTGGIYTDTSANKITLTNNTLASNTTWGVNSNASNTIISGNTSRCMLAGGSNTQVTNNYITGCNGSYAGIRAGSSDMLIANNQINTSGDAGIQTVFNISGVRIVNNVMTGTYINSYAIDITSGSGTPTNTYLSGNTFASGLTINDNGANTIYDGQVTGANDIAIRSQSGVGVGRTTATTSLTVQGTYTGTALPSPNAPTVTTQGTAGSTSYTYAVTALDGFGETLVSTGTVIGTGNATLNGANYNRISWTRVGGAISYKIYRTASSGTPSSTGLIGTVLASAATMQLNDLALVASGSVPSANTTGNMSVAGNFQFAQGQAHTLSVAQAASGAGNDLTVVAGTSGTGANNGGNLVLQAGATGGTGTTGSVIVRANGTDSATAFAIQDSGSNAVLTVDTAARNASGGNLLKIGNSTGTDTALTVLQLDAASANPTSNLSALNGGMFYNSGTHKVSIIENGVAKALCNTTDLGCGTGGGGSDLQGAYGNDASGEADIVTTSSAKSLLFKAGATFDSANLFHVQSASSSDLFIVNSTNSRIQIGSTTGDTTGVVLVLDTKTDATDPTGVDGAMYYNSNLKKFRCYEDSVWWDCIGKSPERDRRKPFYSADFFQDVSGASTNDPWFGNLISSGTVTSANTGLVTGNHQGVVKIRSNVSAANGGYRYTTASGSIQIAGGESTEMVFNPTLLDFTNIRFGFHDVSTNIDPTDGVYFDIPNGGVLVGKTANGGTRSTTGSSLTLSTGTWYRAKIVLNSNATQANFYVYNDSGTLLWSDALTTNIPTTAGNLTGNGVVVTYADPITFDLMHLDYMSMWWDRALTR